MFVHVANWKRQKKKIPDAGLIKTQFGKHSDSRCPREHVPVSLFTFKETDPNSPKQNASRPHPASKMKFHQTYIKLVDTHCFIDQYD